MTSMKLDLHGNEKQTIDSLRLWSSEPHMNLFLLWGIGKGGWGMGWGGTGSWVERMILISLHAPEGGKSCDTVSLL